MESIERGKSGLKYLGATIGRAAVGYCVFDPATGDITQIAVGKDYRRRGIGTWLSQEAVRGMETDFVKVLNVSADNHEMPSFLKNVNVDLASRQFEMLLQL